MPKKDKGGIPTPDIIDPPESMRMTLCIPKNKDHMMAFFGALWELTMWDSWQPDAAHTGKELAAVWYRYWLSWDRSMNDLECEDGMAICCVEPSITYRINPDTGLVEQSIDGGLHWTPASGGIPSVVVQPVPPVTSGVAATKCDAATNVREQCSQWVDQVSNDFDTATTLLEFAELVALAIAGAVLVVLTGGAFTPIQISIITALGAALVAAWGAGKTVFDTYWTTDKLDLILCDAYCNIGEDGSFTDAQFSSFWNDVNGDLPPSPAKMLFMGFLSSIGKEGLNAMAASGFSADADCASCICFPSCTDDWQIRADLVDYCTIVERGEDFITLNAHTPLSNGVYYADIRSPNLSTCCYFDHYEALDGSVSGIAATECGQDLAPVGGLWTGHCIWILQPQSNVPFTAKFFMTDCP